MICASRDSCKKANIHLTDVPSTYWGRTKMTTIFLMTFSNTFLWEKNSSILIGIELCPYRSKWQLVNTGQSTGLVPNRRQSTSRANVGQDLCRHVASHGHDMLNTDYLIDLLVTVIFLMKRIMTSDKDGKMAKDNWSAIVFFITVTLSIILVRKPLFTSSINPQLGPVLWIYFYIVFNFYEQ